MSDDGGEEQQYEYEWPIDNEDENMQNEDEIQISNAFYDAEDKKKSDPAQSLELFESVVMLEETAFGDEIKFRFKALEGIVVLSSLLGHYNKMNTNQRALLRLMNKVARNEASDAITNILDAVSTNLNHVPDQQKQMYQITLEVLKSNNERLWFNTCLRLGRIYLDMQNFEALDNLITELKDNCRLPNDPSNFDQSKANLLQDVFALEIQMCSLTKNNQRMKRVYPQTLNLNSVINDPRAIGIIKECGGKMFMSEKKWDKALEELFESFKNYQESGNSRARTILKYVIMASILSGSEINYSDTREAKVFKDDNQIVAIMNLRTSFENNDINQI